MADQITQEQIIEAITGDADLAAAVTTHVITTEKGQEVVTNKANAIYTERIGDEVKNIHGQYDSDIFEILGEKPGTGDDGQRVKTYDFNKGLLTELKELRGKAETLNKDAEVQRLNARIEELKAGGGGEHWKQTHNEAKAQWDTERQALNDKIQELQGAQLGSQVDNDINTALTGLKFNQDIPEAARQALINAQRTALKGGAKVEDGKVLYFDADGKMLQNAEYAPADAKHILQNALKDILLKDNNEPGGGAQRKLKGTIDVKKVDGKDDEKRLVLDPADFDSKAKFNQVATKALASLGISKTHKDYAKLLDGAYKEYNVKELPRTV